MVEGEGEVAYCTEVAVVPVAYSLDGGDVEGVAIVIGHPAGGNRTQDAGDGIQALELGAGVPAVRITPGDEGWSNWGPNASCRNPAQNKFT